MGKSSNIQRPSIGFNNPHGRLGELAGFKGKPDLWQAQAQQRLMDRYYGDLDGVVFETKRTAVALSQRIDGAQDALNALREDYAAYWLLRRMSGDGLPDADEQEHHWRSAFIATPDRQLALTLAVAGFDTVNPRIENDTPLFSFAFSATANELDEFLQIMPAEQRQAQLNFKGTGEMTPMHVAAFAAGPSSLSLMHQLGGDLSALMTITMATGEVIRGNAAHLAVLNGRVDMTAECMAIDRGLFTRYAPEIKYTPHEMIEACAKVTINIKPETRKAANIAAYAIERPLPFPEVGWVLKNLTPATAPKAQIRLASLN